MTTAVSARKRALRVCFAGVLLIITSMALVPPAEGQTEDDETPLEVLEASVLVPFDGEFEVKFPITGLELGDSIRYSIRQPFLGSPTEIAQALTALRSGEELPTALHSTVEVSLSELDVSEEDVTLSIPIRGSTGDQDRLFLPNAGPHPVEIEVVDSAGDTRFSSVVLLNHLGEDRDSDAEPFSVSMFASTASEPVFSPLGEPEISQRSLDTALWLAELNESLPAQSINLFVDPEILDGLAVSGTPQSDTLAEIRETLQDQHVLSGPWAPFNTEAWATSGDSADFDTALDSGERTVEVQGSVSPTSNIWPLDPKLGQNSPNALSAAGIDFLLLSPYQLPEAESPYPTNELLDVSTPEGTHLGGLLSHDVAALFLADPNSSSPIIANRVGGLIVGSMIDMQEGAMAIEVDQSVSVDTIAQLADGITDAQSHGVVLNDLASTFESLEASTSDPDSVALNGGTGGLEVSGISDRLSTLRKEVDGIASMLPGGDQLSLRTSFALTQSVHRDFDAIEMHTRLDEIEATTNTVFDSVEVITRPITLAAREADLPLRISNDLDVPLNVLLEFESPRLDFVDGSTQLVTLEPGENRLDLPVVIRAGGQFQVAVEVFSPNEQALVTEAQYEIRASVFSGIGLVLSGGALVVLVTWWMRSTGKKSSKDSESELDEDSENEPETSESFGAEDNLT